MDSIGNLLDKRERPEPPEIKIIKKYVSDHFKAAVNVTMQTQQIILTVSSASLAGALRMHTHSLQQAIGGEKRLVIRIGK
jgi:hypothetical protein